MCARASHRGVFSCCEALAPGLQGFSSCGARASLPCGMWNLPGPGVEALSPALPGRFFTTGPPGESQWPVLHSVIQLLLYNMWQIHTFTLHLSPFTSWSPALDPFTFESQFVLSSLLRKQKPLKRPRGRIWPPALGLAGVSVAVDGHCPVSAVLGEDAASGPVSREGLGTWLRTCA